MGMGIGESGVGNGGWRLEAGDWGSGVGSRQRIAETGGWGLGNGESGMGIGDSGIMYKKGAVKNGHHFFTALFYIPYQLVRDLMGAGIFPPRLMNSSARNLLISRTGA